MSSEMCWSSFLLSSFPRSPSATVLRSMKQNMSVFKICRSSVNSSGFTVGFIRH